MIIRYTEIQKKPTRTRPYRYPVGQESPDTDHSEKEPKESLLPEKRSLVLSVAILVTSLTVFLIPMVEHSFASAWGHYAYALFTLVLFFLFLTGFLGIRQNQSSIWFFSILNAIAFAWVHLTLYGFFRQPSLDQTIYTISILFPFSSALVFALARHRILGPRGLFCVLIVVALPAGILYGSSIEPYLELHDVLFYRLEAIEGFWRLPFSAIILLLISIGIYTFVIPRQGYFALVSFFSLIPMMYGLNRVVAGGPVNVVAGAFSLCVCTICAMSLYAIYRIYWEKAYIDQLTGVYNRRSLDERMENLGKKYVVAIIDIDHFKDFNDSFGHLEGDHVLRFVARRLAKVLGPGIYRYGGEEFCALFPHDTINAAARKIEQARKAVESREFHIRAPVEIRQHTSARDRGLHPAQTSSTRITISAGIASKDIPDESPRDAIELADRALYFAKQNGRNRVVRYGDWNVAAQQAKLINTLPAKDSAGAKVHHLN